MSNSFACRFYIEGPYIDLSPSVPICLLARPTHWVLSVLDHSDLGLPRNHFCIGCLPKEIEKIGYKKCLAIIINDRYFMQQ